MFLCKRIIACGQLLNVANLQAKNTGWIKCHSDSYFPDAITCIWLNDHLRRLVYLKKIINPISYSLLPVSKPHKSPSETGRSPPGVALSATGPATVLGQLPEAALHSAHGCCEAAARFVAPAAAPQPGSTKDEEPGGEHPGPGAALGPCAQAALAPQP